MNVASQVFADIAGISNVVLVAVITPLITGSAAVIAILLSGRAEALKLQSQYRHKERTRLRELIGDFHGRMLETAVDWDRRMWQLYADDGTWLRKGDGENIDVTEYAHGEQYLFRSYVFRFLSLCAIARKFETRAIYIDAQEGIARNRDLDFYKYAKAFLWAMTHADLTPQDGMPGRDHFPNDQFRPLLDLCYRQDADSLPATRVADNDVIFDFRRFGAIAARTRDMEDDATQEWQDMRKAFDYFNGLRREDHDFEGNPRYRWDRLVVLHLLAIGFIDTFGYDWQRQDPKRIEAAVGELRYACVADVFERSIRRLGLDGQRQMQLIDGLLVARRNRPSRCEECPHRAAAEDGHVFPRPCPGPHVPTLAPGREDTDVRIRALSAAPRPQVGELEP
jgi:hypothetical protein